MEYINIPLYVIRSNEYIGADPTQRATWLSLIAWSCDQENMGRIAGARSWGDRRWMQSCGVMASEVAARVDRLKAIGNGQVPAVAATAFRVLLGRFQEGKEGE